MWVRVVGDTSPALLAEAIAPIRYAHIPRAVASYSAQ